MQRGFVTGFKIASKCSNGSIRVATASAPKNNIYNNIKSASTCNINSTSNIPASFSTNTKSSSLLSSPPPNRTNNVSIIGSSILSNFNFNGFLVMSDDDDGS